MRTSLPEFEEEVLTATGNFWVLEPSFEDVAMICWTEQDDLLHGHFCELRDALVNIGEQCELTQTRVEMVDEVLRHPKLLNTRIARVFFVNHAKDQLQWSCCEESLTEIGKA